MIQNILYLTIFQTVSFSILSFCRKNSGLADKIIGLWGVVLALQVTCIALSALMENSDWNVISFLGLLTSTLHGAFLLLYTKYVTNIEYPQIKNLRYNVITIILLLVFVIESPDQIEKITMPVRIFSLLINSVYIVKSFVVLNKYKKYIERNFSSLEKLSILWLQSIIRGIAILGLGALICLLISSLTHVMIPLTLLYAVLVFFFISLLFYRRIFIQDDIVRHVIKEYDKKKMQLELEQRLNPPIESVEITSDKENSNECNKDLYNCSSLDNVKLIKIANELKLCMEEKMLYKNMNLTLKDLAKEINVYPHYITQTLNTVIGHNFYDFVNHYRVEEAKRQLLKSSNENLSILGIGYESGFNSKSSFNRIFKLKTGISPSTYKKQQLEDGF